MKKLKRKKKPNGQFAKKDTPATDLAILDPRQEEFLRLYLDVNSEIFGNAYQCALKAGYSKEYAETITSKDLTWLSESVGDTEMLTQAIKNIQDFLSMDVREPIIGMFGPVKDKETGEIFSKDNVGKMKLKVDVSKFVAERLGRKKFGADKGGAVVTPVQINFNNIRKEFE